MRDCLASITDVWTSGRYLILQSIVFDKSAGKTKKETYSLTKNYSYNYTDDRVRYTNFKESIIEKRKTWKDHLEEKIEGLLCELKDYFLHFFPIIGGHNFTKSKL